MAKTKDRYFLSKDNSGHWYLVQADKRKKWEAWCDLDEDDERSWEAPEFARRIDGHPSLVTFSDIQL